MLDGTCADLLGPALQNFPNLVQFHIDAPNFINNFMKPKRLEQVKVVWTTAVKTLFTVAISVARPLEVLKVECKNDNLAIHASVLGNLTMFMKQLKALKTFSLNVAVDDNEGTEIVGEEKCEC